MPIPDNTTFGSREDGSGITYGEVRKIIDPNRQIQILKLRLDTFLINQINELTLKDEKNNFKVWSPFPLSILTLLSIETLGHLICDIDKIKEENAFERSKIIVTPVYKLMASELGYKPSKKFYEAFEKLHGKADKKSIQKYSDVIHKYQRNTFNHGYQAKGVYIDHEIQKPWIINESGGFLVVNPYLFWLRFREVFEEVFQNVLSNANKEWRKNSIYYFRKLLD